MQITGTTNKPFKKRFELEIKALGDYIQPRKSNRGSIGYDLSVAEDVVIKAHSRQIVLLNFAINLPYGYEAKIEPRSGFSAKGMEGYGTRVIRYKSRGFIPRKRVQRGLQRWNADVLTGKIDPNYTDSVGVIIRNDDEEFLLRKGTRIAQMTIYRTQAVWFVPVEELTCENRGGGFGHSGSEELGAKADEVVDK